MGAIMYPPQGPPEGTWRRLLRPNRLYSSLLLNLGHFLPKEMFFLLTLCHNFRFLRNIARLGERISTFFNWTPACLSPPMPVHTRMGSPALVESELSAWFFTSRNFWVCFLNNHNIIIKIRNLALIPPSDLMYRPYFDFMCLSKYIPTVGEGDNTSSCLTLILYPLLIRKRPQSCFLFCISDFFENYSLVIL